MKLLPGRAPNVEKLRRKGDLDGLIRAIGYEDVISDRRGAMVDLGAPVREKAAHALSELPGPTPRRALIRTLGDPEESVRLAGVRSLRRCPDDPVTTDGLLDAVARRDDPAHKGSRLEALDSLAAVPDTRLAERLAAAFLARGAPLEDADAHALRRLAAPDSHGLAAGRVVEKLIGVLGFDPGEEARARASRMLVWLAPDSVGPLMSVLEDPEPRCRRSAAFALGEIRDSRAVERLQVLLQSGDPGAREGAAWALGQIKDPSAVEALVRATGDSSYEVRAAAGAGLDELGSVAVIIGVSAFLRPLLANGTGSDSGAAVEAELANALRAPAPAPSFPGPQAQSSTRPSGLLRRLLERDS